MALSSKETLLKLWHEQPRIFTHIISITPNAHAKGHKAVVHLCGTVPQVLAKGIALVPCQTYFAMQLPLHPEVRRKERSLNVESVESLDTILFHEADSSCLLATHKDIASAPPPSANRTVGTVPWRIKDGQAVRMLHKRARKSVKQSKCCKLTSLDSQYRRISGQSTLFLSTKGGQGVRHDWRHWMLRKEADGSTDRNLEKSMEAGDPVDAFRHWKLQQSLMVCAFNPVKLAEHLAFCIHAFAQMQLLFWVAPATLSKSVE
eukprot:scaffold45220_cov20-Tisochrysis_lutea.AAC.1